jgi:hypothetical protein
VIVVTPRLPPSRDGLGDYCRLLWSHWPSGPPPWRFLVAGGAEETRAAWPDVEVRPFAPSVDGLAGALEAWEATVAVLQYVGYGYDRTGRPGWLPGALSRWKAPVAGRRVVVMFHELWAHGPPWRRSFWTHAAQVRIATGLARLADAALASTSWACDALGVRTGVKVQLAPIPSNVPVRRACWEEEPAAGLRAMVFGLPAGRRQALRVHRHFLESMGREGRLERVVVVGAGLRAGDEAAPEAAFLRRILPADRVTILGELEVEEISERIAECHLFLAATPAHLLTKSGTAMAALAHGCAVVAGAEREAAPLADGGQILAHRQTRRSARELAAGLDAATARRVGLAGRAWYEANAAWPRVADRWRLALEGDGP